MSELDAVPPRWPLINPAPADWPPAEAPMPQDEPTEPIEGLPLWFGTDGSTAEVPVVARRAGEDAAPPGRRWMIGAGAAAALLVLAGVGAITFGRSPATLADYRDGTGAAAAVRAPWDGRTKAAFDLVNGAATISVRTGDLGGDLYRISAPAAEPQVSDVAGRVRLSLGGGAAHAVEVALSDKVRWDLSVGGGAGDESTIDLSDARLAAVDLAGGSSRINLSLPRPDGTVTVRMTGGVSRFDVHTAGQVPVRLRLGSGAGQVVLDGTSHSGVAAGALFTPARWDQTVDRIDLNAVAGMSALTIGP